MNVIKKSFRETTTSIFMVIGLAVSIFILINIAEVKTREDIQKGTINSYKNRINGYIDGCELSYESNEAIGKRLLEIFTSLKSGNFSIIIPLNIGKVRNRKSIYVYMSKNEPYLFEVSSDYDISKNNSILIGDTLLEFATEKEDGSDILIDSLDFNIAGVLDNNMTAGIDDRIYVFWDNLDQVHRDFLFGYICENSNGLIEYSMESEEDLSDVYLWFEGELIKENIKSELVEPRAEGGYQNYWYILYNKVFMDIGLFFSVLCCFCVSYMWLLGRLKEFIIRKAFGYRISEIALLVFRDLIKLCIPAFVLAMILQLTSFIVFKNVISISSIVDYCLIVFGGVFALILLIMMFIIWHFSKFTIKELMCE